MTTEPLENLAVAVSHEVSRLIGEYHGHGMVLDLAVSIDPAAGAVTVRGADLAKWGPQQRFKALLGQAELRYEVHTHGPTIVIYPSTT